METIRSFTTLEQSRKLAEILPLESADMYHFIHEVDTVGIGYKKDAQEFYSKTEFEYLPCWSLAALIGILPRVDIEKEMCSDYTYDYRVKVYIGDGYIGDWFDNPVDACVTIIENLHELNLL